GLWYHVEVGIKDDGRLKLKYDSRQARIKSTMKSTSLRRLDGQANEIGEKSDKVRIDVIARKKKSTKKLTDGRRLDCRVTTTSTETRRA
ncbi:OLC1v1018653C1, partial [Oldenlandia corymbosa var. corymbosa]